MSDARPFPPIQHVPADLFGTRQGLFYLLANANQELPPAARPERRTQTAIQAMLMSDTFCFRSYA